MMHFFALFSLFVETIKRLEFRKIALETTIIMGAVGIGGFLATWLIKTGLLGLVSSTAADTLTSLCTPCSVFQLYILLTSVICAVRLRTLRQTSEDKSDNTSVIATLMHDRGKFVYEIIIAFNIMSLTALYFSDRIAFAIQGVVFVLLSHEALTSYRIRHGYYGSDEEDAREIIEFALRQIDNGGSGSDGTRRPLITSEDLSAIRKRVLTPQVPGGSTQPS
jgi:hypothetical protein